MKGKRLLPLFIGLIILTGILFYINYKPELEIPSYDYLYPIKQNKKVGFIDDTGKIVIEPKYDLDNYKVITKDTKYIAVRSNGKIGYIDMAGNFIVKPKYDKAANIYNSSEFTVVSRDEKYGFVNNKGIEVIALNFDDATSTFSEGLCAVRSGKFWGFIDTTGNFVIEPQFQSAKNFVGDTTLVMKDGLWGLINKKGEFLIDPKFEEIDFDEGNFASIPVEKRFSTPIPVKADGKWGYIDLSGNIIITPQYSFVYRASEDLLLVTSNRQTWLGLDYAGNEVSTYNDVLFSSYFTEGKAPVTTNNKFGTIDTSGNSIIPIEYDDLSNFLEDRAVASKDGKYGYLDSKNTPITDFKFDFAKYFINGVGQVVTDLPEGATGTDFRQGKVGYINKDGDYIWEPQD